MARMILGYALLSIAALLALSTVSSAYTVSLTGSCVPAAITRSHSYISFNLSNTGNGPAQQLVIVPQIRGAEVNQSAIFISALNASSYNMSKIYLHNLSENGTYADSFILTYHQGSNTFLTIYPCETYINKFTQSSVIITNMSHNADTVKASLLNYGPYAIDANVSFMVSPIYSKQNSTDYKTLTLLPGKSAEVSFGFLPIPGNSSFPVGIAAQYSYNGTHYASLHTIVLSSPSHTGIFSFRALELVIIAAIAVIAALIIVSLIVNKKKGPKRAPGSSG